MLAKKPRCSPDTFLSILLFLPVKLLPIEFSMNLHGSQKIISLSSYTATKSKFLKVQQILKSNGQNAMSFSEHIHEPQRMNL